MLWVAVAKQTSSGWKNKFYNIALQGLKLKMIQISTVWQIQDTDLFFKRIPAHRIAFCVK